jgi:hypothetical protein
MASGEQKIMELKDLESFVRIEIRKDIESSGIH